MMDFLSLGAHPALRAALEARGYAQPTPVQAAALDAAHAQRDLVVSAETGSGKTVAFGLALAPTLLAERERFGPPGPPLALVLAPTRELALQVQRELSWLYAPTGLRSVACVGGMEMYTQLRALSDGVHLVVGTPGRVCDHIARGSLSLRDLQAIVLDEADEMLDMGFREELETVLEAAPASRRTLMFSATMPPEIARLAQKFLRDPARLTVSSPHKAHGDIAYRAHRIAWREREHAVVNILRAHDDTGGALVFGQTRDSVHHLQASLTERGFACVAISGELNQGERNRALMALRDGRARVLVATDVAARGIDLPQLTLVIHADLPQNSEGLLHRSGRTGRAGRKGTSVVLVPADRKRFAERIFAEAHLTPSWEPVPSAESIRTRDRTRIAELITQPATPPSDEDRAVARELLTTADPEMLVAQLVAHTRARFPEPEDLPLTAALRDDRPRPGYGPRENYATRPGYAPRPGYGPRNDDRGGYAPRAYDRGPQAQGPSTGRPVYERPSFRPPPAGPAGERTAPGPIPPRGPAEGGDAPPRPTRGSFGAEGPGRWFVLGVGREAQADPKWIVPMLCRRGGISREDIGAIRVFDNETRVEIRPSAAESFATSIRRPDRHDAHVSIAPAPPGAPRFAPSNLRAAPQQSHGPRASAGSPRPGKRRDD